MKQKTQKKLSQFPATAICGNDITSSVLYVSALSIIAAGQYAWIALVIVAAVLYLFRKIYGEVVGALPFALTLLPIPEISMHENDLLAFMEQIAGGQWLTKIISVDAALVLSGAVLTSYVGVTGLLERITLDRILLNYFLAKNRRNSSYRIIAVS